MNQKRGRITICDRPSLEAASCGCYGRVRAFAEAVAAKDFPDLQKHYLAVAAPDGLLKAVTGKLESTAQNEINPP